MTTQYDNPTWDWAVGYKGDKTITGFQAYRGTFPAGTMIYNPAGQPLDVRGQPLPDSNAPVELAPFEKGGTFSVAFGDLDSGPIRLTFTPEAGSYWMDAGYGCADGDASFVMVNKGTTAVVAAGNSGIDEGAPVSLDGSPYVIDVSLNVNSAAVQNRVKAGNPAASGYYILRKKA